MREKGFTLIELSIVLVIIGLIVGGVLVGQSLIEGAEMRRTITIARDFNVSFNTFRTKYNCIPGDCDNFTIFFPTATNGNGNKRLDAGGEFENIDAHLDLAELLPGGVEEKTVGEDLTITSGVFKTNSDVTAEIDAGCSYSAEATWSDSIINNVLAFGFSPSSGVKMQPFILMDSKYDDGNPTKGQLRVSDSVPIHPSACVSLDNYSSDGAYSGIGTCNLCIDLNI